MRVALDVFLAAGLGAAFCAQMLRWLRVLQREHYEPSSMSRFLGRWSSPQVSSAKSARRPRAPRPITLSHVLVVALVVTVIVRIDALVVAVSVLYGLLCPVGLTLKGRTGKLQWTRRLSTIAVVATAASLVVALLGSLTVRPWLLAVAMVWAVPMVLEFATRALAPFERRRAQKFVEQATARLERIAPRVVAITGSYGKTSTKNHLVDLLAGDGGVVASPRSFNNRAGLSRAINENLADGTRVFIAEMGTYGPGEITELCSWCVPEIAVVTAIGPVHLERMKTLDVIERAKFEITARARTVVVNTDDARLARWPEKLAGTAIKVRTAGSAKEEASVRVVVEGDRWRIDVDGVTLGSTAAVLGVQPTNLACAIAAALELGVTSDQLMGRLARVTTVANRLNVVTAPSGVVVIDDTFNANPASALAALKVLTSLPLAGRRVVVTPGMIELGRDQYPENLSFARKVASFGAELVVVGRTNVKPLEAGYEKPARRFDTRDQAVAWVRSALVPGDGVLYLNDLPDHYP
jgi:UDP-N-acetylmuramoyl-tripeptide--D-alanyl-D-alanine ligase